MPGRESPEDRLEPLVGLPVARSFDFVPRLQDGRLLVLGVNSFLWIADPRTRQESEKNQLVVAFTICYLTGKINL